MLLASDIGNSNIVFGIYDNSNLLCSWRIHTHQDRTSIEYFILLKAILQENKLNIGDITSFIISSVVPHLNPIFEEMAITYFNVNPILVNYTLPLGLSFSHIPDPSVIGADLLVNASAAFHKYKKNCIIVDLGTATTIQLVSKQGEFLGTAIIPGILGSAKQLFKKAAKLHSIPINIKISHLNIIGQDTGNSLLSGIIWGNSLMIDGFIKKIKQDFRDKLSGEFVTIATGGIASLIYEYTTEIDILDKNLTLDGLHIIYQKIAHR